MPGPIHGWGLQYGTLCILSSLYCHNIPTPTPPGGYHRVTKTAKNANITKVTAENCISARSTLPTQIILRSKLKTRFRLKVEKTKRFVIFDPKKGGHFLTHRPSPSPPAPPQIKWVSGGLTRRPIGGPFKGSIKGANWGDLLWGFI